MNEALVQGLQVGRGLFEELRGSLTAGSRRGSLALKGHCRGGLYRGDEVEGEQLTHEVLVSDEFDRPAHLLNRVLIILCEIVRNTDDARSRPVDGVADLIAAQTPLPHHEHLELCFVIEEPIEVEEALIDYTLAGIALVLKNDGTTGVIDTEGVNASTVFRASAVLTLEELHSEHHVHVSFDDVLETLLQFHGGTGELRSATAGIYTK